MKRHLILSNQQFISMVERLGYEAVLEEEVQYKCGPDHSCEPFISYILHVKLPDHFPLPPVVLFSVSKNAILIT